MSCAASRSADFGVTKTKTWSRDMDMMFDTLLMKPNREIAR